jgi:mono/diheme cytochrome c family protein
MQTCAGCHVADGSGNPGVYPPLAGSEWVTASKGRLVRIVMHGLTGPIVVAGEEYQGVMPPWGGTLTDAQIAALSTYVRSAWGNTASAVTTAEVTAIRNAEAGRTALWTAPELMGIPAP